jgi:propionyl-CoA synthetase
MTAYDDTYAQWRKDPQGFWRAASSAIEWDRQPDAAIDRTTSPSPAWFPDGRLNTCFNAVDRHVRDGRGRTGRAHLRQPGHQHRAHLHLPRGSRRGRDACRGPGPRGRARGDRVVIYTPIVP